MRGKIDMLAHGMYFFVTAEDGNRYFCPFRMVERKEKSKIHRHSEVEFDVVDEPVEEGKYPKICNVKVVE